MEQRKRPRSSHVTAKQKKKLIEFITKHPELISCKVTQFFNHQDSQKLWQTIADECNSIAGARKTWRQWRKTWQDLRSKTKKRQEDTNGTLPNSVLMLTAEEQKVLGLKAESSNTFLQDMTEFVPLETDNTDNNFHLEMESAPSLSEPESPPETKVFTRSEHKSKMKLKRSKDKTNHANSCMLNCDLLAVHEQKKLRLKEDYINFKKDYLRQKLSLIKEQTEALKTIARELCEK